MVRAEAPGLHGYRHACSVLPCIGLYGDDACVCITFYQYLLIWGRHHGAGVRGLPNESRRDHAPCRLMDGGTANRDE